MVEDVRLALNGAKPVEFYGRCGGNVPSAEELLRVTKEVARRAQPVVISEAVALGDRAQEEVCHG
jgi:hypothetical protein